ncbi:MAG: dihydroorotate dehydrogenase, partial [Clostridium baratii]|nr:dihydroorotate dehydrogenase [Clostridium baratii]
MLKVNIGGVEFKNPVIAASGTFGFGEEYNNFYDVGILGGISSKGLTINKKEGNNGIRVYETPSGMMNSVGLQNPGIDGFIENELPKMKKL